MMKQHKLLGLLMVSLMVSGAAMAEEATSNAEAKANAKPMTMETQVSQHSSTEVKGQSAHPAGTEHEHSAKESTRSSSWESKTTPDATGASTTTTSTQESEASQSKVEVNAQGKQEVQASTATPNESVKKLFQNFQGKSQSTQTKNTSMTPGNEQTTPIKE